VSLTTDPDKDERRRLKKLDAELESGVLDPWERYRILRDLVDHYQDVAEMSDRKGRFALVILGALNAVNLLLVTRPAVVAPNASASPAVLGLYILVYLALSLFLFVQAIAVLKPRYTTVLKNVDTPAGASRPLLGVRFIFNILEGPFEAYYEKWKGAQFADVNRDLALHVRHLAAIVRAKYILLHRLYAGMMVLVFLTAGLMLLIAFESLRR
jgi:hypothetical protein